MPPLHIPQSSKAPTQSSPESHTESSSVSAHAGTSALALPLASNPIPPDAVRTIPSNVKVDPPAISSKESSARTPSPAGRAAPVKSKPITTPVSLLYVYHLILSLRQLMLHLM